MKKTRSDLSYQDDLKDGAEQSALVIVGKIGSTYGVLGWLKVQAYTEYGPSILDYAPWFLKTAGGEWEKYDVESGRIHGKGLIAKLANINSPELAKTLTGADIAITRQQLPALKPGEYYWSDLEGLTVINQNGEVLGIVRYLLETGANDVLIVKGKTEQAIPYLPGTVVVSIDLEKREIQVNWEPI